MEKEARFFYETGRDRGVALGRCFSRSRGRTFYSAMLAIGLDERICVPTVTVDAGDGAYVFDVEVVVWYWKSVEPA